MVIASLVSKVVRMPFEFLTDFIKRRRHFNKNEVLEIIDKGAEKNIKSFKTGDMAIVFKGDKDAQ